VKPDTQTRWHVGYWIVALLALLALQNLWRAERAVETVSYSEFEKALEDGRLSEVVVGDTTVTGTLKAPGPDGPAAIVATRV
jgi:cell division protease FtsH